MATSDDGRRVELPQVQVKAGSRSWRGLRVESRSAPVVECANVQAEKQPGPKRAMLSDQSHAGIPNPNSSPGPAGRFAYFTQY